MTSRSVEECNRRMLRARDAMDRTFAEPLHIPRLAQIADVSQAHFIGPNVLHDQPGRDILLEKPGPPAMDDADRAASPRARRQGRIGVHYGIDVGLRDPFGNHIRIVQLKAGS